MENWLSTAIKVGWWLGAKQNLISKMASQNKSDIGSSSKKKNPPVKNPVDLSIPTQQPTPISPSPLDNAIKSPMLPTTTVMDKFTQALQQKKTATPKIDTMPTSVIPKAQASETLSDDVLNKLSYDVKNWATTDEVKQAYPELGWNDTLVKQLHADLSGWADIKQVKQAYPELFWPQESQAQPYKSIWDILWNSINQAWELLKKRWQNIVENVNELWNWELNPVSAAINTVWQIPGAIWDLIWNWIWTAYKVSGEPLKQPIIDTAKEAWSSLPKNIQDDITNAISTWWEAYNIYKEQHPELLKTLEWVWNIASVMPASKAVGVAGEWLENVAKAWAEKFIQWAKEFKSIPQRWITWFWTVTRKIADKLTPEQIQTALAWIDKSTQKVLKQTPKSEVNNILDIAKNAVEDVHAPTPFAVAWQKASEALNTMKMKLRWLGEQKANIMDKVGSKTLDTTPIKSDFAKTLDRFNMELSPDWVVKVQPWKIANIWDSDIKDLQKFSDNLMELHTTDTMPLKNADDLVDRLQSEINYNKLNRPWNTATKVEKTLSGFLEKSINKQVKNLAWNQFTKINDWYRNLIWLTWELEKILWPGQNRVESLMKTVFSPQTWERTKKIFRAVKQVTGRDLINDSVLAKFAMDAVWDIRGTNLLQALDLWPWFSWLKSWMIWKALEKWSKYLYSPENVWKNLAWKEIPTIWQALQTAKKSIK